MKVASCVVTYRRPDGLERALEGLARLRFEKVERPDVHIVVVDNDPKRSASAICEKLAHEIGHPLEYHAEPRRGISQARNRAVACAAALGADFMAFVDDDEVTEPLWLDELLYAQRKYAADVVGGPVLPYFYEPVPDWIVKGKFFEQPFERPRYPTGHLLKLTAGGNVLIRTRIFEEMGEYFDEELGLTGGEDTLFFSRAYEAGYKLVWADDAVAHEWTPASRANARWLLRRAYRLGNGRSLYENQANAGSVARAVRIAKGCGRLGQGLMLLPLSIPLSLIVGRQSIMKAMVLVFRGAGMLAGVLRIRFEEYR
jgi:succinoglycan biosynthesis protein ExoM